MRIERSLTTPHHQAGPRVQAAVSFGEWIIILIVCAVVSLLVAGAAMFLMMRQGMPDFAPDFPRDAPAEQASILMEQDIIYLHDGVELEGFLVFDASHDAPRPGVLIVHQWMGLSDHERNRARRLAAEGYVAFCADIYGAGIRPQNRDEARDQATKYRSDRQLLRSRCAAGLDWLKSHPFVDSTRTAAIGYCFGGGTVLELARSGAALSGVVSFHGNLDTPNVEDAANIRCTVLVAHGAEDSGVTQEAVTNFIAEMRAQSHVDWALVQYGSSVHGFTHDDNPERYNELADRRSWSMMLDAFREWWGE